LYGYVVSNPLSVTDPLGLQVPGDYWEQRPVRRRPKVGEFDWENDYSNGWPVDSNLNPANWPEPLDPDLRDLPGKPPVPGDGGPGGTSIPGTGGPHQNCFGESIGRREWINWPHLGTPCNRKDWQDAQSHVPKGCRSVSCEGVDTNHTRCKKGETELILFVYRWVIRQSPRIPIDHTYACDFHIIGRECNDDPCDWHSKADRRECIEKITDPLQSCHDAYPHTSNVGTEVVKKCFCCDKGKMTTTGGVID
jgi:hypothetical protein